MNGPSPGQAFIVADIGGTALRVGRYEEAEQRLSQVCRTRVEGIHCHAGASSQAVQRRVLTQLETVLRAYLESSAGAGTTAVGLAFAGPITAEGLVTSAPTIWGGSAAPVGLGDWLERRLAIPVHVANDMTASVWRYADTDAFSGDFCLITVSSGVGNKVYRDGRVLVDASGSGGELGHWPADLSADAARCDCGGRGHLGAIASGRGILATARRAGCRSPEAFAASSLGTVSPAGPESVTSEDLVQAIRLQDAFALDVLRRSLRHLAHAIAGVHAAIGIRRYVIIGGFAVAVGQPFAEYLADELVRMGCFGLAESQVREMVEMGFPDDDHALLGMGRLLSGRPAAVTATADTPCAS